VRHVFAELVIRALIGATLGDFLIRSCPDQQKLVA
jgi:hypothetical protein